MRIAICDDNKEWIETEKEYINRLQDVQIKYNVFYSGEELVDEYEKKGCRYDAIFLDMEMNDIDGINTANKIRSMDRHVMIVFVTNHTQYMQESFVCTPFRFLVKPVSFEEFRETVLAMIENLHEEKRALTFQESRDTVRLLFEDILLIQSYGHCIHITTTSKKTYKTYKTTLADIKKYLSEVLFVQVHRSFIINISHVRKISKNKLYLRDYEESIPISSVTNEDIKRKIFILEERKHRL